MARRTGSITIFAAILAALLAIWAPAALAHHKADHTQGGGKPASETSGEGSGSQGSGSQSSNGGSSDHDGDADSDSGTTYTEDNDGDGKKNNEDTTPSSHPSGQDRYVESGGSGNQGNSESDPDDDGRGPERCEPESLRTTGDGTCGADKPNGTGGTDIYDQDGNNGCGNDQDFDDDNEGWCGKPTEVKAKNVHVCDADATMPGTQKCEEIKGEVIVTTPGKPCDADATMPGVQKCEKPDDVLGGVITQPGKGGQEVVPELETNPSAPTSVLGIRVSAAAQPAAVAPAAVAPAAVAAAPAAQGAVLPFTGTSDLLPLVAVSLMLIAAGALSLRGRLSSK